MQSVFAHLRLASRSLRRTPAFTAAAVVTLTLGIGATASIFSVVNAVLLRPLPYPDSDRLVGVSFTFPGLGIPQAGLSDGTYFLYDRENRVFDGMGAYQEGAVNLTEKDRAERITATSVTASLFPLLRVKPVLGRSFAEGEDRPGGAKVAIIGEGLWRRLFGGDPGIIGRTVQIDGASREVVGVMPAGFHFPNEQSQLWLPLVLDPLHVQVAGFNYNTVARLKSGATINGAVADLTASLSRLPEHYPEVAPGISTKDMLAKGQPRMLVHELRDDVVGDVGRVLWIVLATIGFVLLAACANVANLFLVRAEERQRELAVRSALGAGRGEPVRRFMAEGVVLAVAGGTLGILLTYAGLGGLVRLGGQNVPRIGEVSVDAATLGVTAFVTLAVAVLCSALPVLRFARRDLSPLLREGGRGQTGGRNRQRLRSTLVASQVALALVLLTSSGLMARSFQALRAVQPGFDPVHALSFRLSLTGDAYRGGRVAQFWESAVERIGALPGVRAVGATIKLPLVSGGDNLSVLFMEDHPLKDGDLPPVMLIGTTTSGYFKAAGIPIVAGRSIGRADGARPLPEAVISQSVAERFYGDRTGRAALGRRIKRSPESDWYTIVGVVGDVHALRLDKPADDAAYFPVSGLTGQWDFAPMTMSIVIRTAGEPGAITGAALRAVHDLDPTIPVFNLQSLEEVVRQSMARTTFMMLLLAIASGVAVVLGVVGLYGVVSYTVSLRTQEIGVRMALGARPAQVGGMVARQAVMVALAGIGVGLLGAFAFTRFLGALLFGVQPTDPIALGGAALLLLASAFLASWLPARRAATVDPMSALRAD